MKLEYEVSSEPGDVSKIFKSSDDDGDDDDGGDDGDDEKKHLSTKLDGYSSVIQVVMWHLFVEVVNK